MSPALSVQTGRLPRHRRSVSGYTDAVRDFCCSRELLINRLRKNGIGKEAEIIAGQITIAKEFRDMPDILADIQNGLSAETAFDDRCSKFIGIFSALDDDYIKQRALDIQDVRTGILEFLKGIKHKDISSLPSGSVIVASDLSPSAAAEINKENICGIITENGSRTSHSAIIARAFGIPAVAGVPDICKKTDNGCTIIVDGSEGAVVAYPNDEYLRKYYAKKAKYDERKTLLKEFAHKETESSDGHSFLIYANIRNSSEARSALESGAEGIGLFRTEFLYMNRDAAPDEEEQYEVYSKVSCIMQGHEVIIRTLDVGADKQIPYLCTEKENNPALGHRAIRYCLDNREIFGTQLRALLRAGAVNRNIKIMLPLISSIEELLSASSLIEKLKAELESSGTAYDRDIKVGIMTETPSAALVADMLAEKADFFSIGTNDLTQYTMAADRCNVKVSTLADPFYPAVLRSIRNIISCANASDIPVGMCGEAAALPEMIPLLMAFGLNEFSVSPSAIPLTRKIISSFSVTQAKEIADHVMKLASHDEIAAFLKSKIED